jgi:acyl carrier protein
MSTDRETLAGEILAQLRSIAPEVESGDIERGVPLRHQVDLDSMDWLNFLVALNDRFRVQIPEADYAKLVTLDDVIDYVRARIS